MRSQGINTSLVIKVGCIQDKSLSHLQDLWIGFVCSFNTRPGTQAYNYLYQNFVVNIYVVHSLFYYSIIYLYLYDVFVCIYVSIPVKFSVRNFELRRIENQNAIDGTPFSTFISNFFQILFLSTPQNYHIVPFQIL